MSAIARSNGSKLTNQVVIIIIVKNPEGDPSCEKLKLIHKSSDYKKKKSTFERVMWLVKIFHLLVRFLTDTEYFNNFFFVLKKTKQL